MNVRYIRGVGSTKFSKSSSSSAVLAHEAVSKALQDADQTVSDIDAFFISNLDLSSGGEHQRHHASRLRSMLQTDKPIYQIPAACAGGGSAFHAAVNSAYNTVLVLGVDRLSSVPASRVQEEYLVAADQWWEQPQGLIFPAQAALLAQLYEQQYGEIRDILTDIALKNHEHGFHNPLAASYQKKVSRKDMESSPIISSPLRKFDCAMTVDGAAAIIVSNDRSDIKVEGTEQVHDTLTFWERGTNPSFSATRKAMVQLEKNTGICAKDVDLIELHDAFTIMELIAYEDLGLITPGRGKDIEQKRLQKINLSGGLKAKGHPVSATGVGQLVDIVMQLRQEFQGIRADNARTGLAHNMGGVGGTVVTTLLRRI